MENQVTTIEQSQRLMALGVPAGKASMVWLGEEDHVLSPLETADDLMMYYDGLYLKDTIHYPAFTIADLMEIMPFQIEMKNELLPYFPSIELDADEHTSFALQVRKRTPLWIVEYVSVSCDETDGLFEESKRGPNLSNLLCDMIEWLVSNGYKLEV